MKIGLGTYSYFWQWSDLAEKPITLMKMLAHARGLGAQVFQICDYPQIERMSDAELQEIRQCAMDHELELELGTRGVHPDHLRTVLNIASHLNVKLLRTLPNSKTHQPSQEQVEAWILDVLPQLEAGQVALAIETYEHMKSDDLVRLVKKINHPLVGICLDPANGIAGLETPDQVILNAAPYTLNLHVKDFTFARNAGWVGFSLIGCPLGEGSLDFDSMLRALNQSGKNPNAIIEFWLPLQQTIQDTIRLERQWIEQSFQTLKAKQAHLPK